MGALVLRVVAAVVVGSLIGLASSWGALIASGIFGAAADESPLRLFGTIGCIGAALIVSATAPRLALHVSASAAGAAAAVGVEILTRVAAGYSIDTYTLVQAVAFVVFASMLAYVVVLRRVGAQSRPGVALLFGAAALDFATDIEWYSSLLWLGLTAYMVRPTPTTLESSEQLPHKARSALAAVGCFLAAVAMDFPVLLNL